MAINTPVQGTAADLIKTAMVRIDREIAARSMRSRMLIQVHDELVFESPDDEVAELENLVKEVMEGAITFDVPIVVNIEHGENWGKVH
jgi:DNA polymerase-1